ncbi:MAG: class I SAM-dependent DNA methyltransferase [Clostridia bacterium]|nr:class I SAM-dependent DNA methyltransferase [Clostridia bacterium]
MKDTERRANAKAFSEYWKDRGYEKGESQSFWLSLLRDILGVEHPEQFIIFEEQVQLDHTSFIDGHISATNVLIEQKSKGKDLRKPIKQSDGSLLTPFQQAQRYSASLPYSKRPRWIVTCNFEEMLVYDMEKPNGEPEQILLKDLPKEYYRLQFLVDTGDENIRREEQISVDAGKRVGELYDAILKQYINPESDETLKSLNKLIVCLVFCLYAEDAGIFGGHNKFHDYIKSFSARDMRRALIDLFGILNTKVADRDPYADPMLLEFPYVNGGLFADEHIEIPQMDDTIRDLLLQKASEDFDWSDISPTIFGAVFESTLNPETRRSGGMHYTSIENIHKVIDPLFLDDLRAEFDTIKETKVAKLKENKLNDFRTKLGSLTFFDPACGSGNFLTETYISLRRLENAALEEITKGQIMLGFDDVIKVSIGQFYGIEINDFAVTVAKTALWIAESQMMKETEDIVQQNLEFLPLKSYANIVEGNALRIDWETVVPKDKLNYIMGNPPFVGYKFQTNEQKEELKLIAGNFENYGTLDYVSAWYIKAAEYIKDTAIVCAFVSTNSISQGEHVLTLWKPLFDLGIQIIFAHSTFRWNSEASLKAHVHCVIIGFAMNTVARNKYIFDNNRYKNVENINGYLLEADNIFITKRNKPWSNNTPIATKGNAAMDDGNLTLTLEERNEILLREPLLETVIKQHMSADDFLNNKQNYCFWFDGVDITQYRHSKEVQKRLLAVKEYRNSSNRAATKKMADYPMLFAEIRQPKNNYIMIPVVSSEKRKYVPIAFLTPDIINSYASISIPDAKLYHFGVLMSNVHNSWLRAVCGRLEMRYRYATSLVYNTFPWPTPTDEQKAVIEKTAQAILDARALYPDCSLADLYDELTMPPELRKAHQENDRAVMRAYGFDVKTMTESTCVAELMKMYQELTK